MKVFLSYQQGGETRVDGPLEGIPAIADRIEELRAEGIHEIEQTRLDVVCDFCSDPGVVGTFHIEPGGTIGEIGTLFSTEAHVDRDGLWACCKVCREIIMSERETKQVELARHSVVMGKKIHPDTLGRMPTVVVAQIVAVPHGLFWSRWDGSPPEPVISDEELLG